MCGPVCACLGACCMSCFRGDKQLDACCFCIPLRIGALIFAAFFVIVDIILVVLFTVRYHDNPFQTFLNDNATTDDSILEEIRKRLTTVVHGAQPCVLILIIYFAVWIAIDAMLVVAVVLEWQLVTRIWGCLSMFRSMHITLDLFLIIITFILVKDAAPYLCPNFIALASLIPQPYARCIIHSYAKDMKTRKQIQSETSKQVDGKRPSTAQK